MLYRVLADAVLVTHFSFVVFVVVGAGLILRWRWIALLHLPAAAWGATVQLTGWRCPLTPLENHLRAMGGQAGYSGGFVEHYLLSVLYPDGLTREIQIALGLLVLVLNLAAYGVLLASREETASPVVEGRVSRDATAPGTGHGLTLRSDSPPLHRPHRLPDRRVIRPGRAAVPPN